MWFRISGYVTAKGQPVKGLLVKAYDKDLLYDDLLGSAQTDQRGQFHIEYEGTDFQELFEKRPDIYLKIMMPDQQTVLVTTKNAVKFDAGHDESFRIEIPPGIVEKFFGEQILTSKERGYRMSLHFDKTGNVYKIDDKAALVKKKTVTVFNEAGEEFEIPAEQADEYKLTPDERQRVLLELRLKAADMAKALGICPVIDPACISYGPSCPTFGPSCPTFGRGCLAIDPIPFESIRGTQYTPYAPATQMSYGNLQVQTLLRSILNSCPNIDPANLGTVIGTLAGSNLYRYADIFRRIGLEGCPAIDPPDLRNLIGTITTIKELQRSAGAKADISTEEKAKRRVFVMRALTDPEFRELIRTNPQKAFEKEQLTAGDWQSVGRLNTLLPMIDDVISSISGAILCSGGGGCGLA